MDQLHIDGKVIGHGQPCFIIAEAGINHNGDVGLAKRLIDVAVDAGADAVKFQTFRVDLLTAPDAPKARYQATATGAGESQGDMLRKSELPPEAFAELDAYCHERGIIFISTPFDHESVEVLANLGVPAFKVPSGEVVNLPLLRHIASKGKPIILSTGMSYISEVERAIRAIHEAGNDQLVVLHCVSNYPAAPRDVNLRAMQTIAQAFQVPVGFSDHTLGIEIPLAAVAMGACVIEKHFTLDRAMPGPDHGASLEPHELRAMVTGIRKVEQALGDGIKQPADSEADTRQVARRSIYLRRPARVGAVLREDDLIALRPAGGIPPDQFDSVVGRKLRHAMPAGAVLAWRDLE
jgi:N,N'-diacetyllegionaminate synthase